MAGHRVVVAAILRRGGRILVHQRPPGGWGAGKHEFPGGKLEPGEDPREALARECREELAVAVRVGPIVEVIRHQYRDTDPVLLLFFECTLEDESAEPVAVEGGAVAWSTLADLEHFDWLEADWPLVHRLARGE